MDKLEKLLGIVEQKIESASNDAKRKFLDGKKEDANEIVHELLSYIDIKQIIKYLMEEE